LILSLLLDNLKSAPNCLSASNRGWIGRLSLKNSPFNLSPSLNNKLKALKILIVVPEFLQSSTFL